MSEPNFDQELDRSVDAYAEQQDALQDAIDAQLPSLAEIRLFLRRRGWAPESQTGIYLGGEWWFQPDNEDLDHSTTCTLIEAYETELEADEETLL